MYTNDIYKLFGKKAEGKLLLPMSYFRVLSLKWGNVSRYEEKNDSVIPSCCPVFCWS